MAAGYRYIVGDLRTGKITRAVDLSDGTWSTPLGEAGQVGGSFPLRAEETIADIEAGREGRKLWPTARSDAAAAKSFLAVAYVNAAGDETMLEAGPIWKTDFDHVSGVLSLTAGGLHSYFDHRKVIQVLAAGENAADVSVTYSAAQWALVAKRLVQLAQTHTGGNLPIVLPSDADLGGAGTTVEQTYPGYELAWVGDQLKQLSELDGGPEIQFVPRRRTDDPRFIEWVMRIGVAPSGLLVQSGKPWLWDASVQKSDVRSISISTDGTKMAFRQWAAGQGQAEGRPIEVAEAADLIAAGFPLLEGEVAATDAEDDPAVIAQYASTALAYSQRPIESWTATVSRDGLPTVGQLRPGDWARFRLQDHIYMPDGEYDMRLLNIAGGDSDTVTLTLSERLGDF